MKVFKFGGASVKDANGVKNIAEIIKLYQNEGLVIVVSAMGKTTNALEEVVQHYFNGREQWKSKLDEIRNDHLQILNNLFPNNQHIVYEEVEHTFYQLRLICQTQAESDYNLVYDRIVSYGEIISTRIVSAYLSDVGIDNVWLDARKLIKTDQNYRFARVNWNFTEILLRQAIRNPSGRYVLQGFIGSDDNYHATTLGREGSDYTAAIAAYCLSADSVTIWKDVPGVLNGDPKVFDNTVLLQKISFSEAIELAYYGASVIHPKTIQPLKQKGIPLMVRSFLDPSMPGTTIQNGSPLLPMVPCFIQKPNQALLSISTTDLAFIVEEHLSQIYATFHRYGIRVNLAQNSATSSTFSINHDPVNVPLLLEALKKNFLITYQEGAVLYTVRHYTPEVLDDFLRGRNPAIRQTTPSICQIVEIKSNQVT
ncbi:MAG: aspartate kinase [Thermaurantimonas sp.]